ncbi:MAG: dihydropteroate synthase [Campylobacterota bacterium]|nr:dihydropteroate synthase [Campylobacterota bacterium]
MLITKLSAQQDMKSYLKELGVDGGGISILASKSKTHLFKIENLHVGAANILKQDALSIGADLAVPKGTVLAQDLHVNALLIATTKQLKLLSKKELAQPFGLKILAQELQSHIKAHTPKSPKIMGVINANEDSFYDGSRFIGTHAIEKIIAMIEEGARIIDVGALSSRPGSTPISQSEELERIKLIIDAVASEKLYAKVDFSVDSYVPKVIDYALSSGFKIVNDITGLEDDEVCRLTASYDATAVIMHMQGTPTTMQSSPTYENVVAEVSDFFEQRLQKAEAFGINKIVLDVGIGFGKTLEHNLELIASLEHFLKFQQPLLIGASRKSMINEIVASSVENRLSGTLAVHLKALENGAEILRVHDVKEHVQAVKVYEAIQSF